jgi:hypothetical protein
LHLPELACKLGLSFLVQNSWQRPLTSVPHGNQALWRDCLVSNVGHVPLSAVFPCHLGLHLRFN